MYRAAAFNDGRGLFAASAREKILTKERAKLLKIMKTLSGHGFEGYTQIRDMRGSWPSFTSDVR